MNDRTGIDTHGYSEPPDEPEVPPEIEERLIEIEDQIADLVREYWKLSNTPPTIPGYKLR